jgi:hypothetical protein
MLDDDPKILDDPIAPLLVDPSSEFYKGFLLTWGALRRI